MTALASSAELERSAVLHQLLDGDQLERPARPLSEGCNGRRDPRPEWDAWYQLATSTRRQLLPFMAPAGSGLKLDDLAQMVGAETIEGALELWARACQMARRGASSWDAGDVAEWEAADALADADALLYGPAELAERLGISLANLHQRRHRGLLPAADLTLSRVPIWSGETIRLWQEWSQDD